MIYRSAGEGVPVAPETTNLLNTKSLIIFSVISVLFGSLIAFFISGMDESFSALMPGLIEKLAATFVIGGLFFLMLTALIWLMDILPTKLAFKKASELTGETNEKIPQMDAVIKETEFRDERIDSIIKTYAAYAFYFLFGYIILSNIVKLLFTDVRLMVYYDAFIAATDASGYFLLSVMNTGFKEEHGFG